MDSESTVIFWIPVLVFLSRSRSNDVSCILHERKISELITKKTIVIYLGIGLYLKPSGTQMTFAPERVNGRGIIIPNLFLLSIEPHAHSNVVITGAAARISETSGE